MHITTLTHSSTTTAMSAQTPTRRSTRIASRGNTPAVPGAGNRGRGRGRPGSTPGHAGALPAVQSSRSYAYGASGRLEVPARATAPNTSLAAAFAQAKSQAKDFEHDGGAGGDEGPADTTKSFGVQHEAGVVPGPGISGLHPPPPTTATSATSAPQPIGGPVPRPPAQPVPRPLTQRNNRGGGRDNGRSRRQWGSNPLRNIPPSLVWLLLGCLSVWFYYWPFLRLAPNTTPRDPVFADPLYVDPEKHLAHVENKVMAMVSRVLDLHGKSFDQKAEGTGTKVSQLEEELESFKQSLPDSVVVRWHEEKDKYELTDHFWEALDQKTSAEDQKGNLTWNKWVTRNAELVDSITKARLERDVDKAVGATLAQFRVLSRDEVVSQIKAMAARINLLSEMGEKTLSASVQRAMNSYLDNTDESYKRPLQVHRFLENAHNAISQVNFFSPKLGAVVDPYLTSPTLNKKLSWRQYIWGVTTRQPPPPGPVAALESWEEMGDCWCAALNDRAVPNATPTPQLEPGEVAVAAATPPVYDNKGKAQLAVILPFRVYPTQMVVEHIPPQGTLEPLTAPHVVELWVHVADPAKRDEVRRSFDAAAGNNQARGDGDDAPATACSDRQDLPPEFVCAGQWRYRNDAWNHVQAWTLDVPFRRLGIDVGKAVVRVAESWGKEWVCLYRVRLVGKLAPAQVDGA